MKGLAKKSFVGGKKVFCQNPQTQRFLEVVNELQKIGKFKSDVDISKHLHYPPQSFNQLRKGRRNATIELITNICFMLKGNPKYIILGEGHKLIDSDFVKREIEGQKKYKDEDGKLLEVVKDILKSTSQGKDIGKIKWWSDRILYMADELKRLEANLIAISYEAKLLQNENKVLNRIIVEAALKGNETKSHLEN